MSTKKYQRKDIYMVPIKDLAIDHGFNIRFDYGQLKELADSIKENGVVNPLHVYTKSGGDKLYIIDGHRRFKACKMATDSGWVGLIPVLKFGRKQPTEQEKTLIMLTHNAGKPLNALEEGMVYTRLLDLGMNNTEISNKVGKSVTHVIKYAKLSNLNENLIEKIKTGVVTATMVVDELKNISEEELNEAIDEAISSKELTKITKKHLKKKLPKPTVNVRVNVPEFLTHLSGVLEDKKVEFVNPKFMLVSMLGVYNGTLSEEDFIDFLTKE